MRETTLDHVESENYILYYTSEKKYMNRLRKQMESHANEMEVKVDDGYTLGVKLPLSWFRAPSPPKKGKPMSEEQKEVARKRMKELHASGKLNRNNKE